MSSSRRRQHQQVATASTLRAFLAKRNIVPTQATFKQLYVAGLSCTNLNVVDSYQWPRNFPTHVHLCFAPSTPMRAFRQDIKSEEGGYSFSGAQRLNSMVEVARAWGHDETQDMGLVEPRAKNVAIHLMDETGGELPEREFFADIAHKIVAAERVPELHIEFWLDSDIVCSGDPTDPVLQDLFRVVSVSTENGRSFSVSFKCFTIMSMKSKNLKIKESRLVKCGRWCRLFEWITLRIFVVSMMWGLIFLVFLQ